MIYANRLNKSASLLRAEANVLAVAVALVLSGVAYFW